MIALTVSLGNWQTRRAVEKDVIEARHAQALDAPEVTVGQAPVLATDIDGRQVAVRGTYLPRRALYWDNQIVDHKPGFALIVPLRIAGGERVLLIDRGLLPATGDRSHLPPINTPAGEITVHGRAYLPPARTMELGGTPSDTPWGGVWENVSPAKFAKQSGLQVQDFVLRDTGAAPAGLTHAADNEAVPNAETGMTAARHRGYAFQWYSLAVLAAVLLVLFTFMTT